LKEDHSKPGANPDVEVAAVPPLKGPALGETPFALLALVVGGIAIGASPIFVRLSELGPSATAFWRVALALPVLYLWTGMTDGRKRPARWPSAYGDLFALVLAGLFFTGDIALWHWAVGLTSVANSTLLVNLAPVFVALGGWLLFGERFGARFVAGLAVALAGAAMLVGWDLASDPRNILGDVAALVAAVFYASYILIVYRLRSRFSTGTIMVSSGVVTSVALLPITILSGENLFAVTAYGWAILLGVALLSHAGGQGLIAYALAGLPVAFSSVGLLLQPVSAAVLAWTILDETLGGWQAVGGAVVLVGIVLARRSSQPPNPEHEANGER
jgi:drug/metabolite transporter (DMT)-like permease